MDNVSGRLLSILFFLLLGAGSVFAQPTEPFDLKKPAKFENKRLGSEKTGEKKFTAPKRLLQNTITHYNWFYNANNKLDAVLERAKLAHQDDYSRLLSFYNYSLDFTQSDSLELDSVIHKSTTGILIHDLRNDWIDDLFLLIGKAYYFQQDFDSAHRTFQFINYTWAPKEDDGYRKVIGSNESEGGSAFQVATAETDNIAKKVLSNPPGRNEALLWQVQNFISAGAYADASGLINILSKDPGFPERLQPRLSELKALYFYERRVYDSAAYNLIDALSEVDNREEKARREYLIAQLFEQANDRESARIYYEKVIDRTLNPVMEVYARLNALQQHDNDPAAVEESLATLLKMGKRDRYSRYRDIIYYAAARIELNRNRIPEARAYLLKATQATVFPGLLNSQRSNAFLLLGDLSLQDGEYAEAKRYYDSIPAGDPAITDPDGFMARNQTLTAIIDNQQVIYRQDSLQRLAAMPEAEREKFLNTELRRLRKLAGVEDEQPANTVNRQDRSPAPDLFGRQDSKGDWYFNNANLKSKGYTAFKARWGNRENNDNWRRAAARPALNRTGQTPEQAISEMEVNDPLSIAGLMQHIPLTMAQMEVSNDSIEMAKVELGRLFLEGFENYRQVIHTLDSFPDQYPYSGRLSEVLFYLYFSYKQLGMTQPAAAMLHELQEKFPGSTYEQQVTAVATGNRSEDPVSAMNRKYESIYNLFIEGSFARAFEEKAIADSLYGQNYWTPQLLYIESIYHIRQRDDAKAIDVLQNIVSLFPESAMQEKATTLIDVLSRRDEIERYLTNLEIEKPEDSLIVVDNTPTVLPKNEETRLAAAKVEGVKRADMDKPIVSTDKEPGKIKPADIVLPDIAPEDTLAVNTEPVEEVKPIPEVKIPEVQPIRVDSLKKDTVKHEVSPPPVLTERRAEAPKKEMFGIYTHDPAAPHLVVIVMNKVDPVYVTESRNAFNRYNRQMHTERQIAIENQSLSDTVKLVVMSGFEHAAAALNYTASVKSIAATDIIPWLPSGKYRFIVITPANLRLLQESGTLDEYYRFQHQFFVGSLE